jgi:hypothetical protein
MHALQDSAYTDATLTGAISLRLRKIHFSRWVQRVRGRRRKHMRKRILELHRNVSIKIGTALSFGMDGDEKIPYLF